MYENTIITEPKWKSWIIETTTPLLTPEQCKMVIDCGRSQPPQKAMVGTNKPEGGVDTKKRITTIFLDTFSSITPTISNTKYFYTKSKFKSFWF
jgi:hypothetical protein